MALVNLPVENGALLKVPIWDETKRAKNWAAIIEVDATKPGGLARRWLPKGRGICFYMVEQVALFDVMEFSGDRTAWSGNNVFDRWYGVVTAKSQTEIWLEQCKDAQTAILLAREKRQGLADAQSFEKLLSKCPP